MDSFLAEDVKKAVDSMHLDKAPGKDGMNPAFFQRFWHIVGGDVTSACLEIIELGHMPEDLNDTNIVLIPKVEKPENMSQLRLIALCNVLYKIVAKMLVNRLQEALGYIISEEQSVFIPSRLITDKCFAGCEGYALSEKEEAKECGCGGFKT